jgi:precorrin-6x reductase
MTHPFAEVAAVAAVVVAVGAGTALVLPRPKPAPSVVLDVAPTKTDAERVAELERQLNAIGVEQKQLAEDLRAAVRSREARGKTR